MAVTPAILPSASPILFSCIIWLIITATCSSFINPLFCAVDKTPTPSGLVIKITSPAFAVLFFFRFLTSTNPVTAKPKIGSALSILCPPASGIPASSQILRLPSKTFCANSAGSLSTGQPKIATASKGLPPIAYTSLMALALAMRPKS